MTATVRCSAELGQLQSVLCTATQVLWPVCELSVGHLQRSILGCLHLGIPRVCWSPEPDFSDQITT